MGMRLAMAGVFAVFVFLAFVGMRRYVLAVLVSAVMFGVGHLVISIAGIHDGAFSEVRGLIAALVLSVIAAVFAIRVWRQRLDGKESS